MSTASRAMLNSGFLQPETNCYMSKSQYWFPLLLHATVPVSYSKSYMMADTNLEYKSGYKK